MMALITCPDCGGNVSDSAPSCPHCGRPIKSASPPKANPPVKAKKSNPGCLGVVFIAVIVFIVIGAINGGGHKNADSTATAPSADEVKAKEAEKQANEACKKDLSCIAEKHLAAADVYCKDDIEAQAKHDVKWTDGTFEMKMSRYKWSNSDRTAVTYIGDKASFQNGFGAFSPVTYFCTLDIDTDQVIDVKVMEGRLPKR